MQQSKSCKRHYFSVESILASEEQIPCTFLRDQDYIGKLKMLKKPEDRIVVFCHFQFFVGVSEIVKEITFHLFENQVKLVLNVVYSIQNVVFVDVFPHCESAGTM